MGLFETNPILVIPYVLAIVIAYDLAKFALFSLGKRGTAKRDRLN